MRALAVGVGAVLVWLGCTPTYHRKGADREVYGILDRQRARVLGDAPRFSIDPPQEEPLARLRRERGVPDPGPAVVLAAADPAGMKLKDGLPVRPGMLLLSLRDALELAARHSREFQTEKEDLFLTALALTLQRHLWKPTFLAAITGWGNDTDTDNSKGATSELGVSQLLGLGGQLTLSVTTDIMKFTTHEPRESASSVLTAELVQPLLKGGGRLVARENLTQAERDTVYQVRSFARYRKTFCVEITSQYYRVLQLRDSVINQWRNFEGIQQSWQRTDRLAKAPLPPGATKPKVTMLQVDQAYQDVLRARANWRRALREFENALDAFKLTLGVAVDAAVELDPAEIDRLRVAGPGKVGVTFARGLEAALDRRLDLLNAAGRAEDAKRRVLLARNGLAPEVNLRMTASVDSASRERTLTTIAEDGAVTSTTVVDQRRPARFRLATGTYRAALEGELPLDRKSERNAYREALIEHDRAVRALEEEHEQVTLSVRRAWRNLQEAAQTYGIQRRSVDLARRRVRNADLMLERGTAIARDVLDARESLVNAENDLTRALIDHTLARLALWRDTELLEVGTDGVWREVRDVK